MPYKDPKKQQEYFRQYDANRRAARAQAHRLNPERNRAKWRAYDALRKDARSAQFKAAYDEDPERFRQQSRARYAADPQREMQRHKRWYVNNKHRAREYNWKRDGLPTPLWPNSGMCECCGSQAPDKSRAFNLDHCHATGKFRGWLCGKCNRGIGSLGDNLEGVMRAVRYLKRVEWL